MAKNHGEKKQEGTNMVATEEQDVDVLEQEQEGTDVLPGEPIATEEQMSETVASEPKVTKAILEERIAKGDFRIGKRFKFKEGQKELEVDYKCTYINYFLKDKPFIEYFKEKYPNEQFIILEE